jgi:hypothetical protein
MAASCAGSAQDAFKTLIVSPRMFTASIQKNLKTQFAVWHTFAGSPADKMPKR